MQSLLRPVGPAAERLIVRQPELCRGSVEAQMRDLDAVIEDILRALRKERVAQVPGYAPFRYLRRAGESILLERQNGHETRVPSSVLRRAIEAVRKDHSIYIAGPGRLREYGITHVNSPTWALLRLVPLNKLIE